MMHLKNNTRQRLIVLLAALLAPFASASASPDTCASAYARPALSDEGGTGMGGTGVIAKGSGMGGTGIRLERLAGKVTRHDGHATAQHNGSFRLLAQGDPVCVGETIATTTGSVKIEMIDKGIIEIRTDTVLKIEQFTYLESVDDFSMMRLHRGSAHFITGMLGKTRPQNDLIQTVNGVVGVRGTDHEVTVILPGNPKGHQPGTYDKVNHGVTYIRSSKGEVEIHPGQAGWSAHGSAVPTLLTEIPDFLGAAVVDFQTAIPSGHPESGDAPSESRDIPHFPAMPELPELPEFPEAPELPELPDH